MNLFHVGDMQDGYVHVVREVLRSGHRSAPRGIATIDAGPCAVVLRDPSRCVPVGVGRKPRLEIGAAESCQLVAGLSDAAQMVSITKNFAQFMDGGRLRGAYGPRIFDQLPRAIKLLERDPDTRQAGAVIWRPGELAEPSRDVPCTVQLHFRRSPSSGRLDMTTFMRSNDVFWGMPYDFWMFCNVQVAVAQALRVPAGRYVHFANSLHAYERDLPALESLHGDDGTEPHPPMLARDAGTSNALFMSDLGAAERWAWIRSWAHQAVFGYDDGLPASAKWYGERLKPHASLEVLCSECRYVVSPGEASRLDLCLECAWKNRNG